MTKDIEEPVSESDDAFSELNDSLKKLEDLNQNRLNDANTSMKKLVIQSVIVLLVTVVVYSFKGATWYFWVLFGISLIMIIGLAVGFYFLRKANKLLEDKTKN